MTRGGRGFTFVELLAVTAIVGLLALTTAQLTAWSQREAQVADAEESAFARRELALMRLRSAASRASAARADGAAIVLRDGERETSWCVSEGAVVAKAAAARCDAGALRLQSGGRLLRVTTGSRDELVLIGGAR
jgi:prepilin-type N-terminal cleavage/methylation domain-containing protein